MIESPYGVTIFCDDIRQEVNGKLTLVGCYGSELHIIGVYPAELPAFAALINIRVPYKSKLESLKLVVSKEESGELEEIFNAQVDIAQAQDTSDDIKALIETGERMLGVSIPCKLPPVRFLGDGIIKVRAYLDGEVEVKIGSLPVSLHDPEAVTSFEIEDN
jgi:hypothetical protein